MVSNEDVGLLATNFEIIDKNNILKKISFLILTKII